MPRNASDLGRSLNRLLIADLQAKAARKTLTEGTSHTRNGKWPW